MKSIDSLERLKSSDSGCKKPVGLDEVIKESLGVINEHIYRKFDLSGEYRKPMLLYSRLARGGKTRTLLELSNQLRDKLNINCLSISFNGSSNYARLPDESEVEALYRVLVIQIIDHKKYKGGKIVPDISDWERLDDHIGTDPFVLLIDEMNALCFPIGSEVMKILKTYFLDKINRFLVVSSHTPLNLDDDNGVFRNSVISKRPTTIVQLPFSNDLTKLREMGPRCYNLNHKIVNYYGRIPSLLYAERESKDSSPAGRFYKYNWGGTSHN